jgi:hypothetical protein
MRKFIFGLYIIALIVTIITLFGSLISYVKDNLDAALSFAIVCAVSAIIGAFAAAIKYRLFKQ